MRFSPGQTSTASSRICRQVHASICSVSLSTFDMIFRIASRGTSAKEGCPILARHSGLSGVESLLAGIAKIHERKEFTSATLLIGAFGSSPAARRSASMALKDRVSAGSASRDEQPSSGVGTILRKSCARDVFLVFLEYLNKLQVNNL